MDKFVISYYALWKLYRELKPQAGVCNMKLDIYDCGNHTEKKTLNNIRFPQYFHMVKDRTTCA
jgi:hypothetical protein